MNLKRKLLSIVTIAIVCLGISPCINTVYAADDGWNELKTALSGDYLESNAYFDVESGISDRTIKLKQNIIHNGDDDGINVVNGGGISTYTLDLNGYSITRSVQTPSSNTYVIKVSQYPTFTIKNTAGDTSKITGGNNTLNGGAIFNEGILIINGDISFENNSASNKGGAIYNNAGYIEMSGCTIKNNSAEYGSGISNIGTLKVKDNVIFSNNSYIEYPTVQSFGGAIYNEGYAELASGTKLLTNTATYGGAIYNNGFVGSTNVTYDSNSAAKNGGAIYTAKNRYTADDPGNCARSEIVQGVFQNNNADEYGQAIYNEEDAVTTIASGTVIKQSTGTGIAAIYDKGVLGLDSVSITGNTGTDNGGVYLDSTASLFLGGTTEIKNNENKILELITYIFLMVQDYSLDQVATFQHPKQAWMLVLHLNLLQAMVIL